MDVVGGVVFLTGYSQCLCSATIDSRSTNHQKTFISFSNTIRDP